MTFNFRLAGLALTSAAVLALAACGGGGGSSPDPVSTTTSVPVTVVDGAISNATVCVDVNSNGLCDAGEPSGKTDASGNVNLQVPSDDVGKYPILAIVGTDAVDADHGPVTVPFTMSAPADKPTVVSPLTTLVQTVIAASGVTSEEAEATVKVQTGLNVSLFQDFTKSSTPESQVAGTVARMVVVVTQQQNVAVNSAVGSTALDSTTITKADLDEAVQKKLLELLPSLLTALSDPAVTGAATPEAKEAALLAAANSIVASTGLTTSSVATAVAINNQASAPAVADPITANGQLASLFYGSSGNWTARVFAATALQNTPDSAGNTKYVERRTRKSTFNSTSTIANWNAGQDPNRQADLHYNGSAWVACGFNQEGISMVRNAQGVSDYSYCDKLEVGKQTRAIFDVAGRTMESVYAEVRAAGYTNLAIGSDANPSASPALPSASSILGSTTFPAGSKLLYQTNTPISTAFAYLPGGNSIVMTSRADVAAGRADRTTSAPCTTIQTTTPSHSYTAVATSLESMVALTQGTACLNNTNTVVLTTGPSTTATANSGPYNDNYGFSTLSVGVVGTAVTGSGSGVYQSSYYSGNLALRVAFGNDGSTVKYLNCQQRSFDGSARNCVQVGTGSYSIATVGDARVMTLDNQPSQFSALNYRRIFVERGGKVYFGYQSRPAASSVGRLNLVAANALLTKLSVPTVDPDVPLALTLGSYTGDWRVQPTDAGLHSGFTTFRINSNGTYSCIATPEDTTVTETETCTMNLNPANGAVSFTFTGMDPEDNGVFTGTFDFMTGTVTGTFTPDVGDPESISGLRR